MSDLNWTMNCILFGARITQKLSNRAEVIKELKNLTSEIDDETAEYLYKRLVEP